MTDATDLATVDAAGARRPGGPGGSRVRAGLTRALYATVAAGASVALLGGCGSGDAPGAAATASTSPAATASTTASPTVGADTVRLVLAPDDLPGHPDLTWRSADLPLGQWCLDRLEPAGSPTTPYAGHVFTNDEDGQISEEAWAFPDADAAAAAFEDVRSGLASVADGCARLLDSTYEVSGVGDEALLGEYVVADPDPEQDRVVTVQAARTGGLVTLIAQEGLAYDYGLGPIDDEPLRTAVQRHCASSGGACVADHPTSTRTYPSSAPSPSP